MKTPSVSDIFEQLPEHKRREAEKLHQRLVNLLEAMQQNHNNLLGSIAELFGARKEVNRERVIWHGIVAFANVPGMSDADKVQVGLIYFKSLASLCTWRLEGEPPDMTDDLSTFRDLALKTRGSRKSIEHAFAEVAPALQDQLRKTLSWLVDPNSCSSNLKEEVLRFLHDNSTDNAIDFSIEPVEDFDKTGNRGYPLFYWKRIIGYQTLASPIAKFIYDQIEKYHADELPLDKAVPVVRCKRAVCGRFVVPRRRTKEFCTDSCRTLHRQETQPDAHAEYMRKYRADNY